ncbi:hypothetical protein [Actinomadura rugatobispora]|uniref:Uncharacterized protein n=1 Tax=Actinomadura rugatobispora TaxID=1994 RepID=A0ABW1A3D9_9ACTN
MTVGGHQRGGEIVLAAFGSAENENRDPLRPGRQIDSPDQTLGGRALFDVGAVGEPLDRGDVDDFSVLTDVHRRRHRVGGGRRDRRAGGASL